MSHMRIESASPLIELPHAPQTPCLLAHPHVIFVLPKMGVVAYLTASCLAQVSYKGAARGGG